MASEENVAYIDFKVRLDPASLEDLAGDLLATAQSIRGRRTGLKVRVNPSLPDPDELLAIFKEGRGNITPGLEAVWRAGCDAGMVAK